MIYETRPEEKLRRMTEKHPGAWAFFERCRNDRGTPALPDVWPDWCYIPIAAALAYATRDEPDPRRAPPERHLERVGDAQLLAALAGWRMGRGIYRFDPDFAAALIKTPLDGDIPVEMLYRLPEWCLYITAPASWPDRVRGFFVHLERDANTGRSELRLLYDFTDMGHVPISLHMHEGTVEGMVDSMFAEANRVGNEQGLPNSPLTGHAKEYAENMRVYDALNLILYLCADDADFGGDERPRNPEPVKTKRGMKLFPASGLRVWEIGKTVGERLRAAQTAERQQANERSTPRPHLRRAHWHTFRVGKGRMETRVRWLHPILVGYGEAGQGE